MTILTHYANDTYFAEVRSSVETGFKKILSASCTIGDELAAVTIVRKYYGECAVPKLREITNKEIVRERTGGWLEDARRKHTYRVWTLA